jgi:hypothetical protein
MAIKDTVRVRCPQCDKEQDAEIVQSLNARADKAAVERLLQGELNLLTCVCGKRTPLAANVFFHDPDEDFYCHVCPNAASEARARAAFAEAGASGTQRLVPSMNALVEKVKILEAGLQDWAVEIVKLLLLGSVEETNLNRVLLFDRREDALLAWIALLDDGAARALSSPLEQYARIEEQAELRPQPSELQIDRAWATVAVRALIHSQN